MLARKGIFTTPSIMQSHVSVIRALARVAYCVSHLHILYHKFKKSQQIIANLINSFNLCGTHGNYAKRQNNQSKLNDSEKN